MITMDRGARRLRAVRLLAFLAISCGGLRSQSQIVDVKVHSAGLEHNLLGDSADQPVSIYLPSEYARATMRRFPVLYFLHGYADPASRHDAGELFRGIMDGLVSQGLVAPMIVVLPNGVNKFRGAFYANSTSTGNWEDFIVRDVVSYVDAHYRTDASANRRGIAGHSMGGYGALTLAFRHPDVFSVVYAMSPCCTDLAGDMGPSNGAWGRIGELQSPEQVPEALNKGDFFVAADTALIAALAPDPQSHTFGDAPFVVDNKQVKTNPLAFSRIAERMPANMVFPLLANISQLKGIFVEYGAQENFTHIVIGANELSQRLSQAGVSHTLEIFQGDHVNHFVQRLKERMLPWISDQIARSSAPPSRNN